MRLRTRPNGAAARSISAVIGAIPPFIPARAGRASFRTGIELVRYAEAADAAHVSAALLERDEAAVVAAAVAVVLGAPAVDRHGRLPEPGWRTPRDWAGQSERRAWIDLL